MRQILPTIVVIGFMGAGKTSVGRLVARALGREFVDTDLMIERAARMTIAELFQREGELSFRRREMAAIDRAISVDRKSTRLNSSHSLLSRMPSSA